MVEIIAAVVLFVSITVVVTLVLAGIMTLIGVVKGIDLEHLHDDEE
jgi:hypothetical protein